MWRQRGIQALITLIDGRGLAQSASTASSIQGCQPSSLTKFDIFDPKDDSPEPIEDEHHMNGECSRSTGLFRQRIVTVGQYSNQPNRHRLAKFLTWAKTMRVNLP